MAFDAGAIVGKLRLDKATWDSAIGKVKADSKSLQGAILNNSQQIKRMGMAVSAAGAGISLLFRKIIKDSIGYGLQLDKMAKQSAMTTEEFSKLAYAAEQEHASMEGLTKCIPILAKYMEYAREGQETYTREFDKMGISVTDATGELKSTYTVLLQMADYYKTAENKTQALAIATTLLGRRGADLVPLLKLGRQGIEELGNEAESLGIVMKSKTAASMKEFDDKLTAIKAGLKGVGIAITEALLPMLDRLMKKIKNAAIEIVDFIKKHPELFRTIMTLTALFGGLALVIGPLLILLPGITAAAVALGIGLGPLTLIIAGVAAAIAIVVLAIKNWRQIILFLEKTWWTCLAGIQEAIKFLLEITQKAIDVAAKLPGKLGESFKNLSAEVEAATESLEDSIERTKGKAREAANAMKKEAGEAADALKEKVTQTNAAITDNVEEMTREVKYRITDGSEYGIEQWGAFGSQAISTEEGIARCMREKVVPEMETAFGGMSERLQSVWASSIFNMTQGTETFKGFWQATLDIMKRYFIEKFIKKILDAFFEMITKMQIKMAVSKIPIIGPILSLFFQHGGYKPKGVWGIAGEAGPEIVTRPTLLSPAMEAEIIPLSNQGMAAGQIIVRANFYGDIRTEVDFEEMAKKLGNKVRAAIRGD